MASKSETDAIIFKPSSGKSNETPEPIPKSVKNVENLYYNLNDGRIKKAIIFNHMTVSGLQSRHGTNIDRNSMNSCLQNLGFEIDIHQDAKLDKIMQTLKEASELKSTEVSCIVVVVMTHGGSNNVLYATDKKYPLSFLTDPFLQDSCKLTGVPKIFFIQACRGNQLDEGKTVEFDGNTEKCKAVQIIPTYADFLIMYATMQDHKSFRGNTTGSCFIQNLCKELNEKYQHWDLLQILTFVSYRVAYEYVSDTYDGTSQSLTHHKKKQMPHFESTLTKLIKFNATHI